MPTTSLGNRLMNKPGTGIKRPLGLPLEEWVRMGIKAREAIAEHDQKRNTDSARSSPDARSSGDNVPAVACTTEEEVVHPITHEEFIDLINNCVNQLASNQGNTTDSSVQTNKQPKACQTGNRHSIGVLATFFRHLVVAHRWGQHLRG